MIRPKRTTRPSKSTKPSLVYQLKVSLQGVKPPIWRRLLVDADTSLGDLHFLLQVAMGWSNGHLHAFSTGRDRFSDPLFDLEDFKDAFNASLKSVARKEKSKLLYDYDFGDGWSHSIVVEKMLPPAEGQVYPRCIAGKRACPPEDCGGVWGYEDLLSTLSDESNPEYEDMLEWVGPDFDPERFDVDELNEHLIESTQALKSYRLY